MSSDYTTRPNGVVHLSSAHWQYLIHAPLSIKAKLAERKAQNGESFNLQIIKALEAYFRACEEVD